MLNARRAVLAFLVSSSVVMAADGSSSDPDMPQTDIRKEMLSQYKYSPTGGNPAAKGSAPANLAQPTRAASPTPGGRDIVVMSPFEVQASGKREQLQTASFQEEPPTQGEKVASKLGIGVHRMKIGKVSVFASTIFYIPFLVGMEW